MEWSVVPLEEDNGVLNWKAILTRLWIQVFVAVNKAVALLVVVGIHKALDAAATWVIPHGWERFLR
ncbi:MAG: hypothetical protein ACJ74Z_00095 [Bryobacteraceae bacterium]